MRRCPTCHVDRSEEMFRYGSRPCLECIRAKGRERERLRRLRDGDRIRAADRGRVRSDEQKAHHREHGRVYAEGRRREAGLPVRRKGSDPVKVEAQRVRELARRRVPEDQRKQPHPYASPQEKRDAYNARRRVRRKGPAGEPERADHRARQRAKRLADPDSVRAREREAAKRWRRANREAARAKGLRDSQVRNARKRGADVREVTARDRHRMEARQRGRCAYCGERKPLTVDHVIPLSRGGRHAIGNLVLACEQCNKSKGARLLVEWRLRSRRERVAA